ncbi:MAG: RsiV family protein [Bacteroidia bacterium]|nr:RsiV family protein [Bacteroidia bacterium]
MEKKVLAYSSMAAILLVLSFLSCDNNKRSMFKADNGVEFDTISREKQHFLDNNPENPSCNLTLNFVYPKNITGFNTQAVQNVFVTTVLGLNYDSLSVDDAVDSYIKNYIENYKNDAEIYIVNRPSQAHIENLDELYFSDEDNAHLPEVFYSYYENLSDSIVYNQYGIISYRVRQVNNKGGRLSYETVKNYVLDLSTAELLGEADIFSAGYDVALRSIIQDALFEANNVRSIRELEDLGFFGIDEILPNKNFLLTDKGIIYTFNKGEYSAYQLPVPEIFIPYNVIRPLLRENSIALKLSRL